MAKFRRKRVIFAKLEVTYGTDPVPVAADAILTKNLNLDDPYAGDRVARDLDRPTLGLQEEININPHVTLSFDVEIAGSGTPGTAPKYGRLLKACGFTETPDPDTTPVYVEYAPNSTLADSVTLYLEIDGQRHIIKGARGNVVFNFQRGIPFMHFTFAGLYTRPAAGEISSPDFTAFQVPVPVTKANTTMTLGAYSGPAASLTCDMGMQVYPRNVIDQEEVLLTDRSPTGQIVIDMPDLGDINVFEDFVESHAGTIGTGALALQHGTAAGNIVEFEAPKVQLSTVSEGDDTGLAIYTLNARYIPDAGDDEVLLTVR